MCHFGEGRSLVGGIPRQVRSYALTQSEGTDEAGQVESEGEQLKNNTFKDMLKAAKLAIFGPLQSGIGVQVPGMTHPWGACCFIKTNRVPNQQELRTSKDLGDMNRESREFLREPPDAG
eukprot:scaffold39511_cov19-Tisochrysis_lutea.AAC.3